MACHEFAILECDPQPGQRFDCYEPEAYDPMLKVDDDWLEPIYHRLEQAPCFWHVFDQPRSGWDLCGINLIPPFGMEKLSGSRSRTALELWAEALGNDPRLEPLRTLLLEAKAQNRWVLHYGL